MEDKERKTIKYNINKNIKLNYINFQEQKEVLNFELWFFAFSFKFLAV